MSYDLYLLLVPTLSKKIRSLIPVRPGLTKVTQTPDCGGEVPDNLREETPETTRV